MFAVRALRHLIQVVCLAGVVTASTTAFAQYAYVVASKDKSVTIAGSTVSYTSTNKADKHISRGDTGSFVGSMADWKSSYLPANIESQVQGIRHSWPPGVSFHYWWADNVRTLVVVRINLEPLLGESDSGIETIGLVTTADNQDTSTLDQRLERALREAVRRMPATLEGSGINDQAWGRLLAAAKKDGWGQGVPYELVVAYDSENGDNAIWNRAHELLDQHSAKVRRIPFLTEKIGDMAKLYNQDKADSVGSSARMYAGSDNLPVAWFWQAWLRVDRNDYGPETVKLVENAERALQSWKNDGVILPLTVTDHELSPYGSSFDDGHRTLEDFQRLNGAYVHYLRGIVEENLANRTNDNSQAAAHRAKAKTAFKQWFEECRYGGSALQDPMMMRAAGIALVNGTRGYPQDIREALIMFGAAAELGSVDALNWLGLVYEFKLGLGSDAVEARGYYEKAAAKGNRYAKYNLAMMNMFGTGGLPKNRERALSLYRESILKVPSAVEPYFQTTLVFPVAETTTARGDTLKAEAPDYYPLSFITAPGANPVNGRDLQIKVTYRVASGGTARLQLTANTNQLSSSSDAGLYAGPIIKVEGSGQATLWLGCDSPALFLGKVKIDLLHPTENKVLASVDFPVVANWTVGELKRPVANARTLSPEENQKIEQQFKDGVAKGKSGDLKGAIAAYDEVLRQDPTAENAWFLRGCAKQDTHDTPGALADLAETLRLNPEHSGALRVRAAIRYLQNDLTGSLADFDAAVTLAPKDPELLEMRGEVRAALGKPELALDDFSQAIEQDPKNITALYQRGQLDERRQNHSAALADYSRVIQLDPNNADAWSNRAWIKFYRSDWAGALEDSTKTAELAPNYQPNLRLIAYIKFGQGDYTGTVEAADKAAGDGKSVDTAYVMLVRHYALLHLSKPDNRIAYVWGDWKDHPWLQALAKFASGQIDEEQLEAAARQAKDDGELQGQLCEMHFYAGLARLQNKDRAAARLHFQSALATGKTDYTEYVLADAELKRL